MDPQHIQCLAGGSLLSGAQSPASGLQPQKQALSAQQKAIEGAIQEQVELHRQEIPRCRKKLPN